jgi:hypothetical protein
MAPWIASPWTGRALDQRAEWSLMIDLGEPRGCIEALINRDLLLHLGLQLLSLEFWR